MKSETCTRILRDAILSDDYIDEIDKDIPNCHAIVDYKIKQNVLTFTCITASGREEYEITILARRTK